MTTLVVAALREEAAYLDGTVITGPGKARAAAGLARALTDQRPEEVVVVGTAGAVNPDLSGVLEIGTVSEHDLDVPAIERLVGVDYGATMRLAPAGPHLGTGDVFVAGDRAEALRNLGYDLVDMEGFAYAVVAQRFGVPIRIVKAVSDNADDAAFTTWRANVDRCARALADWVGTNL